MQGNFYSGLNLSQEDKIFVHLILHGQINNDECREKFGCKYSSSLIRNLRRKGIKIESIARVELKPCGNKKYYVDYILASCQPQNIKRMIQIYKENLKEQEFASQSDSTD